MAREWISALLHSTKASSPALAPKGAPPEDTSRHPKPVREEEGGGVQRVGGGKGQVSQASPHTAPSHLLLPPTPLARTVHPSKKQKWIPPLPDEMQFISIDRSQEAVAGPPPSHTLAHGVLLPLPVPRPRRAPFQVPDPP